jgi:hypothetical protein
VQSGVEQRRDALVVDRARPARAQLIVQALDAAGDRLQLRLLLLAQQELCLRSTHRHRGLSIEDTPM